MLLNNFNTMHIHTFARDATISSTIKSPHKHLLDDELSDDLQNESENLIY